MQKVMLQARDPGCQHVEPFGRDQGENGALGGNAVLEHTMLAFERKHQMHDAPGNEMDANLEDDVIGTDTI